MEWVICPSCEKVQQIELTDSSFECCGGVPCIGAHNLFGVAAKAKMGLGKSPHHAAVLEQITRLLKTLTDKMNEQTKEEHEHNPNDSKD